MDLLAVLFFHLIFVSTNCAVKNVLFVTVDDLRPVLGIYGGEAVTPNIDNLGQVGATFWNAFAQMALCAPSRNSFLTSRRPNTIRLYDFYSYWRDVSGNFTTLPQYLKDFGYDTYSIGKVFHPGKSSNFTDDFPYSWSEPAWHPPSEVFKDSPVCHSQGGWHSNLVCPVVPDEQPGGTLPDLESVEEALAYLKTRRKVKKPFFLALGFHKPHIPLKYPRKYLDLYPLDNVKLPAVRRMPDGMPPVAWNPWNDLRWREDIQALNVSFPYGPISDLWARRIRQSYFAAVSYVDSLVGRVIHGLRQYALYSNTLIVILGDHGWSLGEHGEWSKYSNFDVALRTPLIIRVPNVQPINVTKVVELIDVFPTVVDLLDLPPMSSCVSKPADFRTTKRLADNKDAVFCTEGKSLVPALFGGKAEPEVAYSQYPRPGPLPSHHPDSDRPKLHEIRVMGYSVRTPLYRYTLWVSWRPFIPDWSEVRGVELYDHLTDPNENLNLAGRPALQEVENELRDLIRLKFTPRSEYKH